MPKQVVLFLFAVLFLSSAAPAITSDWGKGANTIEVLYSSTDSTVLQYNINHFNKTVVNIGGKNWYRISLPGEAITEEKGYPELPVFNRSIIIGNKSQMRLEMFDFSYRDISLEIAPSKGPVMRNLDPEAVPYTFSSAYTENNYYPDVIATLSEPYILRDFRGIIIRTTPFTYNPLSKTLRIYTSFKMRIYCDGSDTINTLDNPPQTVSQSFLPIYTNHFLNWEQTRYIPVSDSYGKLLVICPTNYLSAIAPYVNWKKQKGIQTELVEWSTIGNTATQLRNYIQNRYLADNTLCFVQIVGDHAQVPSIIYSSGSDVGGSDPSYALVAGGDNYPDIFVGRFSAENAADVTTQVNKVIAYERDLTATATWLHNATGIGSEFGVGDDGEYDYQHIDNIRTDLLNYGYQIVDQLNGASATAAQVTSALNTGRGFMNYCGHGNNTLWGTTGYNNTNVNALANGNMTPFIMDVACLNGNFTSMTCFAEAWLRKSGGGALGIYASSINQSWNPPMVAQDEVTDLMVSQTRTTLGGLYFNGSCKMLDEYNDVAMYKTWNIFGDASLQVRTRTPQPMAVSHPASITNWQNTLNVSTGVAGALICISYSNSIYASGLTDSQGNACLSLSGQPAGDLNYIITVTAFNRVTYTGIINQIQVNSLTTPIVTIAESAEGIILQWEAVPNASQYQIFRSSQPFSGFTLAGTATGLSFSESDVPRTRFYYVKAVIPVGN